MLASLCLSFTPSDLQRSTRATKVLFTWKHLFLLTADVEAFAKAMESETKSEQEGDSKDKKDDEEDMSLDWEEQNFYLFIN